MGTDVYPRQLPPARRRYKGPTLGSPDPKVDIAAHEAQDAALAPVLVQLDSQQLGGFLAALAMAGVKLGEPVRDAWQRLYQADPAVALSAFRDATRGPADIVIEIAEILAIEGRIRPNQEGDTK